VEKLTELGVAELHLLETTRTVVHPGESKVDKLNRYVIEASKQCGRNRLMRIVGPRPWAEVLRDPQFPPSRWIAHPGAASVLPSGDYAYAIGPEGGFTQAEVAAALDSGWQGIGLGPRILRIETAALALASHLG
jgi:16S rRNA (uracil1498-N3)-methyltransferase